MLKTTSLFLLCFLGCSLFAGDTASAQAEPITKAKPSESSWRSHREARTTHGRA
jgi:hypothetical protein